MNYSRTYTTVKNLAAPAMAVIALLLFLELFEPWRSNLWWRELFNFGHWPLFGVIGLLLLSVTRLFPGLRRSTLRPYVLAAAAAALLAALSEIVQIGGPRDADIYDFLRDSSGILSFLLIRLSFDRQALESVPAVNRRGIRSILCVAAIGLFFISSLTIIRLSIAWMNRDRAFPVLFTFEHRWEATFFTSDNAGIAIVNDAMVGSGTTANQVLQIDYRAATYTGLILQDFFPDWSSFDTLSVTVYSLSQQPEQILFRVDDVYSRKDHLDRFERVIPLPPGQTDLRLPLFEIAHGPGGRLLDLKHVKRIVLFSADQPRRAFSLRFDNIWLH
jgi:hypothetical protein